MAIREVTLEGHCYTLSYEFLNPSQTRTILFLHGWGSHKELMRQAFGAHLSEMRHLYLDLPGFGRSTTLKSLTTHEYAAILRQFLDETGVMPDVIVGHSFGGKLATLLSPPLLVLLSSSGIPLPKPLKVRMKRTLAKSLKPIFGDSLRPLLQAKDAQGLPPHMYETFKNVVDEDFTQFFGVFRGKVLLFWGDKDTATPSECGERIATLMPAAHLEILAGDHYFFLDKGGIIAAFVQKELPAP